MYYNAQTKQAFSYIQVSVRFETSCAKGLKQEGVTTTIRNRDQVSAGAKGALRKDLAPCLANSSTER